MGFPTIALERILKSCLQKHYTDADFFLTGNLIVCSVVWIRTMAIKERTKKKTTSR